MFITKKKNTEAIVSAVMGHKRNDRAMKMAKWKARCVKVGDIHEFLISIEYKENRKLILNNFVYLGFFEFKKGGVIEIGDRVTLASGKVIAEIIGFDDEHLPNHMNIVAKSNENKTGEELGLNLMQKIIIVSKNEFE